MKTTILLIACAFIAAAQTTSTRPATPAATQTISVATPHGAGQNQKPIQIVLPTQPAGQVCLQLSSDAMTALEAMRRDPRLGTQNTDASTGVTTIKPQFATVADLYDELSRKPGELLEKILNQYPPESLSNSQQGMTDKQNEYASKKAAVLAKPNPAKPPQ